jgi:flagellar hook protein FlgE
MSSSLSSGLTGLTASQQYIDVVGNNIANANTPGYKGQRAIFSELLSQTFRPATGPGANVGGTNPIQVGLGVQLGALTANMGQGGFSSTGRVLDLGIEGEGFFALTNGTQRFLTRVGSFGLDSNGTVVDQRTGYKVLSPTGSSISINANEVIPAKATTQVVFQGNLPAKVGGPKAQVMASSAPFTQTVAAGGGPAVATTNLNDLLDNQTDYVNGDTLLVSGLDADGTPVNATFTYGTDGVTVGSLITFINNNYTGATAALKPDGTIEITANNAGKTPLSLQIDTDPKTIWANHSFIVTTAGSDPDKVTSSIDVFDQAGLRHNVTLTYTRQLAGGWNLDASMPAADGTIVQGQISGIQFGPNGAFAGIFGPNTQMSFQFAGQPATQSISMSIGTAGTFDGVTQTGDTQTVQAKSQDGYTSGDFNGITVDASGNIIGVYSNGQQKTVAEIGVATLTNTDGLSRDGDTLFVETANSGTAVLTKGSVGKAGLVRSGVLEQSNVDIAHEFVNLIEAQRGFQANARVISSTDQMLSELVNIIR